jgi:hypothetical protein
MVRDLLLCFGTEHGEERKEKFSLEHALVNLESRVFSHCWLGDFFWTAQQGQIKSEI